MASTGVTEAPHPLIKVPGCRNPIWDPTIGRWVIYRGLKQQISRDEPLQHSPVVSVKKAKRRV